MTEDNDNIFEGAINLDINAARALRDLLEYFIKMWPGAPARPAEEQEFAHMLLRTVNQIILEYNFTYLNQKDDRPKEDRGEA